MNSLHTRNFLRLHHEVDCVSHSQQFPASIGSSCRKPTITQLRSIDPQQPGILHLSLFNIQYIYTPPLHTHTHTHSRVRAHALHPFVAFLAHLFISIHVTLMLHFPSILPRLQLFVYLGDEQGSKFLNLRFPSPIEK